MTTFEHVFNFSNNEEMSYCLSHLDCYVSYERATENEFDGDGLYEVRFVTTVPIAKSVQKKMLAHFDPEQAKMNQVVGAPSYL